MELWLGIKPAFGNPGCSVACLEWYQWDSIPAYLADDLTPDKLYDENGAAKEARCIALMLRKTPRPYDTQGLKYRLNGSLALYLVTVQVGDKWEPPCW